MANDEEITFEDLNSSWRRDQSTDDNPWAADMEDSDLFDDPESLSEEEEDIEDDEVDEEDDEDDEDGESDQPDNDDEDESDGEDDEEVESGSYSKRVARRMSRLRQRRREAEEAAAKLQEKLSKAEEDTLEEAKARYEAQMFVVTSNENHIDELIKTKRSMRKFYQDNDEEDMVASIDDEIDKLKDQRRELSSLKSNIEKAKPPEKVEKPSDKKEEAKTNEEALPQAAQRWMQKNNSWLQDSAYSIEVAAITAHANKLINDEGFDLGDKELYDELDEVIAEKFPHLSKSKPAKRKRQRKEAPKKKSAIKGSNSAPAAKKGSKTGKRLTAAQLKNMQMFGLDPDNPEHRKSYILENNL